MPNLASISIKGLPISWPLAWPGKERVVGPGWNFIGQYDAPSQAWTVALAGESALQLIFPGAPPRKLIPRHGTRFDVQDLTGITLEFKQDAAGQAEEVVVYTPGSAFVVPKKR